ncbi:alpha/beta fold hydrolase [Nocardia miyunensis]|uniref:alpha/beta fold hydrolase n=1 Tax=Nocardia miyunensis TaxID=282684 RepID=UPI0008341121|nr:alpha/beta hydrolase [Nocardia miyunensis]
MRIEVEPGVSLHVQDVGSGPCVVMLHGWALGHEIWDRQVRALVELGRRVIAIDLRGHGRSDAPFGDYSVERLADDVTTVLESRDARDVALVGWSLGGLVAFRVAATHPELVRKLVLVGSNGVANARKAGFPFGLPAEEQEDAVVGREKADRIASRRALIIGAFAQTPDQVLADWLLRVSLQTPSWVGAAALKTLMRTDQVDRLAEIDMPVVQILGRKDPILSQRAAAWLQEQLRDGQQVWLEECGHFPMLEAPDSFDGALVEATA